MNLHYTKVTLPSRNLWKWCTSALQMVPDKAIGEIIVVNRLLKRRSHMYD